VTEPLRLAVVGLGRAGRARVRAAETLAAVELAAVVTRGDAPGARSFEEVLGDPSIDAVVVCTPNLLHAGAARRALEAEKHVAVEYPLARGAEEARELFDLARRCGRVLHVEHIELLSPSQKEQRRRVSELGRLVSGTVRFRAGAQGWILDPALAGSPALRALARLHRLVDLFGGARARSAALDDRGGLGYRLDVTLEFASGGAATLVEERAPELGRSLEWDLLCERGRLGDPPALPAGPLFLRDLEHFVQRIREDAAPYVSEEGVLHGLDLVESIESLLRR
jgi:predicted dehydrogenase